MYAKLILRSALRSAQDYLVYIATLTTCTTLFYAFLSVSSRFYKPDIVVEYNFTVLSDGMKVAICAVTLLLVFLIRFVNRYMLHSRQQEFALEAMMGIEQRTIGRLFFAETLIMGGAAVIMGIGLGAVCSQFITALLLTSYGRPYQPAWTLFPDTALWTAAVFLLIFLAVGLSNTRAIRRTKIIDMLSAGRRNEAPLQKSRWMQGVAGLYLLLSVLMAVNGGRMLYYYGDSRLPRPVQLMFWANILVPACLPVWTVVWLLRRRKGGLPALVLGLTAGALFCSLAAASVPVMQRRYALAFGGGGVNQALTFLLADLLFFLCGVVWLASSLLAQWKARSPAHRYRGESLFFFGQMISKLVCTPSRGQRNKSTKNISSRLQIKVMLFHRCQNAKVTLETFRVVVMDITANHFHQFSKIRETLSIITFSLQDAPKSFHRAIVNAAANTRHTLCHASIDQPLVEVSVGILKSTVTVEDRMRIRISLDCLCKSVEHKFVVVCIPNHKGNNTSVI